jgi:hypothetical protein
MPKGSRPPPPVLELELLDEELELLDEELEEELEDELLELEELEDELELEELELLDELDVELELDELLLELELLDEELELLELLEEELEDAEPEPVQAGGVKLPSCDPCMPKPVLCPGCSACQLQQLLAVKVDAATPCPGDSTTFQLPEMVVCSAKFSITAQSLTGVVPVLTTVTLS